MQALEDFNSHSVACKLLRELSSSKVNGLGTLRRLQAGSLMGCLTHLSLAGCTSIQDDPAWGQRPLLTSQYAAVFLANPHLQYVDFSNTRLSNHGIFFLILEMALCDPLLTPTGLKHLKQLMLGPPVDCAPPGESNEPAAEVYISSVAEALAELYFQSPALQLVALLLPGDGKPVDRYENSRDTHATMRDAWCQLNEDNQTEVAACITSPWLHPRVLLRTRRGHAVVVEQHSQVVGFSKARMSDDWISIDKANVQSILDCDKSTVPVRDAVLSTADEEVAVAHSRHRGRVWANRFELSHLQLQRTRCRYSNIIGDAAFANCDRPPSMGTSRDVPVREHRCRSHTLAGTRAHGMLMQQHSKQREYAIATGVTKKARSVHGARRTYINAVLHTTQADRGRNRHVSEPNCMRSRSVHVNSKSRRLNHKARRRLHGTSIVPRQVASRTVEALLPDFDLECQIPRHSGQARETGLVNRFNILGHMRMQHKSQAMAPCSPDPTPRDMCSLSPMRDRCHSDPGAHVFDDAAHSDLDTDVLSTRSKSGSPGGANLILSPKRESPIDRADASWLEGRDDQDEKDPAPVGQRRARRRLLPLWESPTARAPNAAPVAVIVSPRCQQSPGYSVYSDSSAHSPESSKGLSNEVSLGDQADAQYSACTMPLSGRLPAHGASHLRDRRNLVSGLADLNWEDNMLNSPSADDQDKTTSGRHRLSSLHIPPSYHGSTHNAQHKESRLRMSGAQRRRLRRLQQDERMQLTDPQGWSRLQQTMQAMMPYGWDKRKEQHPIGVALDPTAFIADNSELDRIAVAALPVDTHNAEQSNCPATGCLMANAPELVTAYCDDLESDDDFDPTFRRAPPSTRHTDEQPQCPESIVERRPNVLKAAYNRSAAASTQLVTISGGEGRSDCPFFKHAVQSSKEGTVAEGILAHGPGNEQPLVQTPIHEEAEPSPGSADRPTSQERVMPEHGVATLQPQVALVQDAPTPLQPGYDDCARATVIAVTDFSGMAHDIQGQSTDLNLPDKQKDSDGGSITLHERDAPHTYSIKLPASESDQALQFHGAGGNMSTPPGLVEWNQAGQVFRAACQPINVSECDAHVSPTDSKGASGRIGNHVCANARSGQASGLNHKSMDQPCTSRATSSQQCRSAGERDSIYRDGKAAGKATSVPLLSAHPASAANAWDGTAAEAVVNNNLRSNDESCCASSPKWGPAPQDGDAICTAAGNMKSRKSRAQRELERLSIFNWDKRKVEHPVGKQLDFETRGSRRTCSGKHIRPSSMPTSAVPIVATIKTTQPVSTLHSHGKLLEPKSVTKSPCHNPKDTLGHGKCHGDGPGLVHPVAALNGIAAGNPADRTCTEDLTRIKTGDDELANMVSGHDHQYTGTGCSDATVQRSGHQSATASYIEPCLKRKSRLSRLPRPSHRANPA